MLNFTSETSPFLHVPTSLSQMWDPSIWEEHQEQFLHVLTIYRCRWPVASPRHAGGAGSEVEVPLARRPLSAGEQQSEGKVLADLSPFRDEVLPQMSVVRFSHLDIKYVLKNGRSMLSCSQFPVGSSLTEKRIQAVLQTALLYRDTQNQILTAGKLATNPVVQNITRRMFSFTSTEKNVTPKRNQHPCLHCFPKVRLLPFLI